MKDKTISFTIPLIPDVLNAFAQTLANLADGLTGPVVTTEKEVEVLTLGKDEKAIAKTVIFSDEIEHSNLPVVTSDRTETTTAEQAFGIEVTTKGSGAFTVGPGHDQVQGAKPTYCAVCGEVQFNTESGIVCKNGHGGAESLDAPPLPSPEMELARKLNDASAPPPPPTVELDAAGLPHDVRIHAKTKTKMVNGNWKRKRGVDPMLVVQVETELRNALAVVAPPVNDTTAAPLEPESDVLTAPIDPACAGCNRYPAECEACKSDVATTAPAPPATTGHAATQATEAATITTFAELNQAIIANSVDITTVEPVVQSLGLASYALLSTRPDLIPNVVQALGL